MYDKEAQYKAAKYYVDSGVTAREVIEELGYPSISVLMSWVHKFFPEVDTASRRGPDMHATVYTAEQIDTAVNLFFKLKNMHEVCRRLGYPTVQCLKDWVTKYHPGVKIKYDGHQYTKDKRKAVVDYCIGENVSYEKVYEKFGYPNCESTLYAWINEFHKDSVRNVRTAPMCRDYSKEQVETAVELYKKYKNSYRVRKELGYPKHESTLRRWVDKCAPGVYRHNKKRGSCGTCVLDSTDACERGAGRAVDDSVCEKYINGKER